MKGHEISWRKDVDVCTDEAIKAVGNSAAMVVLIMNVTPSYCFTDKRLLMKGTHTNR
jgi:hypothetical protein